MDIGEAGRSGRHRLDDGAAIWLPVGGELDHTPHERAVLRSLPPVPSPPPVVRRLPSQRARDPYVDTDAMGLRKFNIGLVPASVTPPRTWKRAAWFAVLSSAGVLVGLAIAAAKLVGSNNPSERIGMPGYPTDSPLLTGFTTTAPPSTGTSAPGARTPSRGTPEGPHAPAGDRVPAGDHVPVGDRTSAGGSSPAEERTGSPTPTSAPVVTVPEGARPVVDADVIAVRTERFYEQVIANADTVMAMVADSFRPNAEALLEQRFADVSLIEVTAISVDPAHGVTVSTLQVTHKDGSTSTEKRELAFTTIGDLLINAEGPATGA